jgi:hypothetical protein
MPVVRIVALVAYRDMYVVREVKQSGWEVRASKENTSRNLVPQTERFKKSR